MLNWVIKNKNNIILQISFLCLSFLFIIPMLVNKYIPSGMDWGYHINRILELSFNLKEGNLFPQIYTYTFENIGYPLNIFYPWLTLFPFAILKTIISNQVVAISLGFMFWIYVCLNLTYHVGNKFFKNNKLSLFTSIIYVFQGYIMMDVYTRLAIGEFLGIMFIPVCFYGIYSVLYGNYKDWPYLAFGMSFVLLSHILTTFILSVTFTIMLIISLFTSNQFKQRFKRLIYSALVAIASSAIFLFPFLEQQLYQKFGQPSPMSLFEGALTLNRAITTSINGDYEIGVIGFLSIVIIITGSILYKKLSKLSKLCYILGLVIFISSTKLFPWQLFEHTIINVIQFPYRLLMLTNFFLAIVGGEIVYYLLNKQLTKSNKLSILTIVMLIILVPWLGQADNMMTQRAKVMEPDDYYSKDFKIYHRLGGLWLDQYTPLKGKPYLNEVIDHTVYVGKNKETTNDVNIISKPNKLIYKGNGINNQKYVQLPIFDYKNLHIYRNGKELPKKVSKHHTLMVTSGSGPITVKYKLSLIGKLGITISLSTWIISLFILIKHKINKKE